MNKRGRNRLFVILGIFLFIVLVAGIFAATDGVKDAVKNETAISENVKGYVENFVEKRGIKSEDINNVTEVNFEDLPKEVNIKNVTDANLAIYQVNYNKSVEEADKIFVITYSTEKLKSQGDIILSQDKREFLNFGFNGEMDQSGFLKTASGVEGSLEKGYVMMRSGSIVGISTNLEILGGEGNLEIVIYKNGEPVQFGNSFVVDSVGVKKDYDVQSKNTVSFEPGDIISLYVKSSDGIVWKDDITLVEIITN